MNANELADLLSEGVVGYKLQFEAATMLRQQQAEIEALKAALINKSHRNANLQYTETSWINQMFGDKK